MLDERSRRRVRLRDNLDAYATILKNSGLPAQEAVAMVKVIAGREMAAAESTELAIRSVLDAYYPD